MVVTKRDRKEVLEAGAVAFLSEVETPHAPSRLKDYGLERIWARAEKQLETKTGSARRIHRSPTLLRHVIVITLVVLVVMLASTTGAYALSCNAQPESPLYGTKIFFERARITLTPSRAEDIRLEMSYSERRMEELQNMVASGNQEGADRWLREYRRNIEGAGILFETMSPHECEGLSTQFQEMLDRQAHAMHGLGQGQPSGLSEPIEKAYNVCDGERMHMRQRSGRQDQENVEQEPGGQQRNGNCPAPHESSKQEGQSTPAASNHYDITATEIDDPSLDGDPHVIRDTSPKTGFKIALENAGQVETSFRADGKE